jgi:hypothetical protein
MYAAKHLWGPHPCEMPHDFTKVTRTIRCFLLFFIFPIYYTPPPSTLIITHSPTMAPMEKGFSWSNIAVGEYFYLYTPTTPKRGHPVLGLSSRVHISTSAYTDDLPRSYNEHV